MGANRIVGSNPRYTTLYQRQMLWYYLQYGSYDMVAYQMGISKQTVKHGLARLRAHCGAKTNNAAALELNMAMPGWMVQVPKRPIIGYQGFGSKITPIWAER